MNYLRKDLKPVLNFFTTSVITNTFTLGSYLLCTIFALILGAVIAFCASYRSNCSKGFLLALFLMPTIVETVILLVNGSIGTGLAVMGAFSLVRFRSIPGSARSIAYIFASMAAGLACATGYLGLAVLFTFLICLFSVLFIRIFHMPYAGGNTRIMKITIPESLNYTHAFDDLFSAYTTSYQLLSAKTTNMGSLYKLRYLLELKPNINEKDFIDALRCRNGNLEIMLGLYQSESEEL